MNTFMIDGSSNKTERDCRYLPLCHSARRYTKLLRGIAEYEGRYFVIGDRLEIRTEEYGDRGTSVMYLAEIDLSWL